MFVICKTLTFHFSSLIQLHFKSIGIHLTEIIVNYFDLLEFWVVPVQVNLKFQFYLGINPYSSILFNF